MKYRYSYDYVFIPSDEIQVGDKLISDLSISVKFNVYYKGEELFFDKEDSYFVIDEDNKLYLSSIISCVYNRETMFEFLPTPMLRYAESKGYKIKYEVTDYSWGVLINDCFSDGEFISRDQFEQVFRDNAELFNNINNFPAQNISYFFEQVKEESK